MCKSSVMKQAHALCRETIQAGDNYHVTLGACIRAIHAAPAPLSNFELFKRAVYIDFGAALMALWATFMLMLFGALVVGTVQAGTARIEAYEYNSRMAAIDTAIQASNDYEFKQLLLELNAIQTAYQNTL